MKNLVSYSIKKDSFSQSGKGLVEIMGVLTIAAILSIGGISGYGVAMSMIMQNRFIDAFQEVIFNAGEEMEEEETTSLSGNYFSKQEADSYRFVDISRLQKAAIAVDNRITVSPLGNDGGRISYRFYIEFQNLPSSLCHKLINLPYEEPVCVDDGSGYMYNITEEKEDAVEFCAAADRPTGTTRILFQCDKK